MINKKKVAAVMAVETYFQEVSKESKKVSWTDHRVGWANQPRNNWTKQK